MVKTALQVNYPRAMVFGVLTTYSRWTEWVPGCEKCVVKSTEGQISTIDLGLNSMKKISMELRFDAEPDQLLKFELVSSKDVKGYAGSYKLMNANEGGTLLITELELDAGAMAPKFMVDKMLKSGLEATGAALLKHLKTLPPPEAPAVPKEPKPEKKGKPKRPKCLLRVVKTDSGERVWFSGRMFRPE